MNDGDVPPVKTLRRPSLSTLKRMLMLRLRLIRYSVIPGNFSVFCVAPPCCRYADVRSVTTAPFPFPGLVRF